MHFVYDIFEYIAILNSGKYSNIEPARHYLIKYLRPNSLLKEKNYFLGFDLLVSRHAGFQCITLAESHSGLRTNIWEVFRDKIHIKESKK